MQTTRLHISGLTPSISSSDLKQRFSTFGDVRDVDGVGKLDGVGRPRKFAYLTLETTQPKLSQSMNLLSGPTWKGAKLRIGEAKPDYKSRRDREVNPLPPLVQNYQQKLADGLASSSVCAQEDYYEAHKENN